MDIDNQYKIEERNLVFEIRERAMLKSKESFIERNVFLALVKIIDKVKNDNFSFKEVKMLKCLKKLNKSTSTGNLTKYQGVSELTALLSVENEEIDISKIKDLNIPNWNSEQTIHERGYHILNELNKISFKNKIESVKNPMTYREIYRNNLIMAIQFKMRSDYEQENLKLNNEIPLVKEHFMNFHKNYFKDLIKFRITKMKGVKIEDYPIYNFAKNKMDQHIEKTALSGVVAKNKRIKQNK